MHTVDRTAPVDDLWHRVRQGFAMPDLDNDVVGKQVAYYAARPEYLQRIFDRGRIYLYHIVEELEKRNLPTELALLPMVESAFNPMAYSRAHASGLWQFIPGTGRRFELQQNWWYDGRRDIVASTKAALDYLTFLYEMHGDWHLALASYNWGEGAVARAIAKNRKEGRPTDYWSLNMPPETRQYIPKLQALKNIIVNPEPLGIALGPIPNQPYFATYTKLRDIDVQLAAKLAEMPVAEFIALNPGFSRPIIRASVTPRIVLPADKIDVFHDNLAKLRCAQARVVEDLPPEARRDLRVHRQEGRHDARPAEGSERHRAAHPHACPRSSWSPRARASSRRASCRSCTRRRSRSTPRSASTTPCAAARP